jgi:homoserine kinase
MVAAWAQLAVHPPDGLQLSCRNAVPHGRGLGSSATSIVAGVVAAQGLCDIATGREQADGGFDREFTNNLAAALEGKGAFRRFQCLLNRHETYRVHWRVFSTERRSGRARAWLADQGYDAVP